MPSEPLTETAARGQLLSGYRSTRCADELETHSWLRRDIATGSHSSAARGTGQRTARVESLGLNPAAADASPTLVCEPDA